MNNKEKFVGDIYEDVIILIYLRIDIINADKKKMN